MKKLILLVLIISISFMGCTKNSKTEKPHEHVYISHITEATCTDKGFTEYLCECGDSYTDNETSTIMHSGRYECVECKMDFGEAFKRMIQENGVEGRFTDVGNYVMETYSNDNYEIIMALASDVAGSTYSVYLSYSSFEKKWTWMLDWDTKYAIGEFEYLSSASIEVPCSYSNFSTSVASMVKDHFSVMIYNANKKLSQYNANFTMENLGLKF